jgi:arylsulfatase A-like enzyme
MNHFFTIRLLWLLACLSGSCALLAQAPDSRPNFLFILTDDQRWDALGHAGNPLIHTPEMDRLAASGYYFPHAFVTTPICAASRATLMTGQYERNHGFTFGTPPLDSARCQLSYPRLLREAGYHTGFLGKFGMNWAEDPRESFDHFGPENQNGYWKLTGPGGSQHIHLTDYLGDQAVAYLEERERGQPFCLSLSFHAPHANDRLPEQYVWPPRLDSLYAEVRIPDPLMGEPEWFEAQPDYVKSGLNRLRWYWRFDTPEKYQRRVKGHYRMLSAIDENLGKIRQALEAQGLADNTLIVLMGDNGYFLGERGLAGKWLMYEPSLRVPLVIYDPRPGHPARRIEQMALNLDLAPTFLDLAGLAVPADMQGQSLLPLLEGKTVDWRGDFLCEHLFDMPYIPQSEGVRTERYKYFRYRADPFHEELYDLQRDPEERHNLADDPAHTNTLLRLRQRCEALIESQGK